MCPRCAAALNDARRVEQWLRARPAPKPPASFTARTMTSIRRARWRREQLLDATFNVAIGLGVLMVIVAVWLLLNRSGMAAVGTDAVMLVETGLVQLAHRIAPSLPLYAAAAALVASALGVWWWTES